MLLRTTHDLEYIAHVVSRGDDSRQESSTKTPAISAATHRLYDGFLYQCRVSPKISARVGGNRNGGRNGFLRKSQNLWSYPGNEHLVDNAATPRVPVLITRTLNRGSKASINPYAG